MTETILTGYLLRGITSLADVESIVFEMKNAVAARANVAYKKLVEWQTERFVDEIALNREPRPERESILEVAVSEVRRRMFYAASVMQPIEFDLYVGLQIMTASVGNLPSTYLKTVIPNDVYSKAFRKIKELEPYDISTDDLENKKGEKARFYELLLEKYGKDIPLASSLLDLDSLSFSVDELKFRSPSERAEELAREQAFNRLLACYACDKEIRPNKLAEYSTFAFERMKYEGIDEMIRFEKANLERILPVIDVDLVVRSGTIESDFVAPQEANSAGADVSETSEEESAVSDESETNSSETSSAEVVESESVVVSDDSTPESWERDT